MPEDISVIGFDDIEFSEIHDPALTTMRQPRREMGRQAMNTIVALLEGTELSNRSIILTHELIERASAGRAPTTPTRKSRSRVVSRLVV